MYHHSTKFAPAVQSMRFPAVIITVNNLDSLRRLRRFNEFSKHCVFRNGGHKIYVMRIARFDSISPTLTSPWVVIHLGEVNVRMQVLEQVIRCRYSLSLALYCSSLQITADGVYRYAVWKLFSYSRVSVFLCSSWF
jgi:hypothetical protein